jgi:hypothetical protein
MRIDGTDAHAPTESYLKLSASRAEEYVMSQNDTHDTEDLLGATHWV